MLRAVALAGNDALRIGFRLALSSGGRLPLRLCVQVDDVVLFPFLLALPVLLGSLHSRGSGAGIDARSGRPLRLLGRNVAGAERQSAKMQRLSMRAHDDRTHLLGTGTQSALQPPQKFDLPAHE